jgi:type IV pilus assembly protein PilW
MPLCQVSLMKHPHPPKRQRTQQGFSLIELLIATTLGLVITLGVLAVFASSASASRMVEAQSRMNEDAQIALGLLSLEIQMAGHNPINSALNGQAVKNLLSPLTLHGCSGMFYTDASSVSDDKLRCELGVPAQPHALFVRYEADTKNTTPSIGIPTDCLGYKLTAQAGSYYVAENRYYIGISQTISAPSLYCKGNGGQGTAQPMVENIEDLQLRYGTLASPGSMPKRVAGYLSATEVEKLATAISKDAIARAWGQVLTVQICIVVRSEARNLVSDKASSIYTKCDGTQDTGQTDRRLRRAYTTTVALRNRLI